MVRLNSCSKVLPSSLPFFLPSFLPEKGGKKEGRKNFTLRKKKGI